MTRALEGRIDVQNDFTGKFPNTIESLVVKDMEYNDLQRNDAFKIESYQYLKEIIIHDGNFSMCSSFVLSNLPLLQTLVVGDNSFNLWGDRVSEAPFSITNCPSLRTISIGESFHNYTSFHLSGGSCDRCVSIDCDQLQSFTITSNKLGSFCLATKLCLESRSFWYL